MALQIIDYSKIPSPESPWKNMLENVLKGYQMEKEPAKMAEEQKQRELATGLKDLELKHKPKQYALNDQQKSLANALSDLALKHKPTEYKLADALKVAQTDKAMRVTNAASKAKAAASKAKATGDLGNFIISHPDATPDDIKNAYEEMHKANLEHTEAMTRGSQDVTAGRSFDKLPVNEKKREIGLMTALGEDPVDATKILRSGKSATEHANEKGLKISDYTPIYPMGEENIKQLQKRRGYVNELKNLETRTAEPMSRYPSKFKGYSFDQIVDSIDNKDPNAMGQVLASRALAPEIAALRLKVAGGNIGIEAINELTDKSMNQLKIIEGLVDSPTYLATQKYITQWLEEAADSFQTTMEDYGRLKGDEHRSGKTYDLISRSWK